MKTTKQLMKELENKSPYWLAWSVIWRWFVIVAVTYIAMAILGVFLLGLTA